MEDDGGRRKDEHGRMKDEHGRVKDEGGRVKDEGGVVARRSCGHPGRASAKSGLYLMVEIAPSPYAHG
jgi:hypothetical protein